MGLEISGKDIVVDPTKVDAVMKWHQPTFIYEVHSFLVLVGYYRRFIKDLLKIAFPMTSLTRKDVSF